MEKTKIIATSLLFLLILALSTLSFAPNSWFSSLLGNNTLALHEKLLSIQQKIPTQTGKNLFATQSHNLTSQVDPEFVDLDSQIISCNPDISNLSTNTPSIGGSCVGGTTVLSSTKDMYLGGQCCGAMTDTKEYHENLKKLQSYKSIPDIPLNPHKTPIPLAQKWISYDNQTTLNGSEQQDMDHAMAMSKERPCCCKCWHYFVNEGIAKKLIRDYAYTANQIDDYWASSDIC